jgi:hypothetical protein
MEKLEFTALKQKKVVDVDYIVNYLQPIRRENILKRATFFAVVSYFAPTPPSLNHTQ